MNNHQEATKVGIGIVIMKEGKILLGEPKVMEPEKVENWEWYDISDLPQPLFGVEPNYIEALKTGGVYFEVS